MNTGVKKIILILVILSVLSMPATAFTYIESYNTSEAEDPHGIATDGNYLWIINSIEEEVYKYYLNGTYTGTHWDTSACGNTDPYGITTNGTYIWITDRASAEVYKYQMDGTNISKWSSTTMPYGITTDSNYIWVMRGVTPFRVYKYQMDGTFVDYWSISEHGNYGNWGVTTNSTYIWITDTNEKKVFKYQMDGTYTGDSFSINENILPFGITNNNISMWIADNSLNYITRYSMILDCKAIDPINVEETTVDLKGFIINLNNATCGFWYNTTTPANETGTNVTCTGSYNEGDTFTKSISGLTSGDYYYYRAWVLNSTGFYNSTDEETFLTKPEHPTNLEVTNINATSVTLAWDNATTSVVNQTSVLVYSSTCQPTSVSDGTIAYNGTAETYKVEGLNPGLHYYFSLWTYINASGSPFYWWFSDSYDTAGATTVGGIYNITFRWECNQTLIDAGIDFQNSILVVETLEGELLYTNSSLTSNPTSVNVSKNPDIFRFDYNSTGMVRSVITTPGVFNYTIYVCCYPEWDGLNATLSNYQIYYTFAFTDFTTGSIFALSSDTQLNIYKYNESGKFYIHQDYWSAEDNVKVALHYGERFYLGVECSSKSILFLQYIDALTDTLLEIDIIPEELNEYVVTDFVNINSSRISTGLWINYTDVSFTTNSVNVSIYHIYPNNDTKILEYQYEFTTDTSDYLWTTANGYNNTYSYKIVLVIDINEVSENCTYIAFSIPFPYEPAVDPDWFDNLFDEYIIDLDGTIGLTFSHLAIFILAFTFLIGLGHKWASLGMIACGMMLCIGFTLIFESPISFGGIVLGVLFIAFGILFIRSDFIKSGGSF